MSRKKKINKTSAPNHINKIKGIVIILLSVLAISDSGFVGAVIMGTLDFLVGEAKIFAAFFLIFYGYMYGFRVGEEFFRSRVGLSVTLLFLNTFLFISQRILNSLDFTSFIEYFQNLVASNQVADAGIVGYLLVGGLEFLVGDTGMTMIMIVIWFAIIMLIFDFEDVKDTIRTKINRINTREPKRGSNRRVHNKVNSEANKARPIREYKPQKVEEIKVQTQKSEQKIKPTGPIVTKLNNQDYQIPSIEILGNYGEDSEKVTAELEEIARVKAQSLIETLESFKLRVNITNVLIGPNVTKYELKPEAGVKINKFNSISNDIALSLAAKAVRIEAPIPGKAAIGIEIPNDKTMMVGLKQVLASPNNNFDKKLQVGLGKDITGNSRFIEINKTPHMLVAGSTGSGKSVCINGIIVSLLTKTSPDDVKLIMIDPKKVELTPFNGIPHLLAPVVTEPKKAAAILKKMVIEMEYRYELFSKTNTRNIEGYNKKVEDDITYTFKKLPYIVIIVDELADLMMVASNEVEESIARLAQMARAAGIHLILATQRPSTEVITGLIKANIPTRIAFAVSSSIDSRTILDATGAEKLLGKGDMLISEQGSNNMVRIQGAFIDDKEVMDVVEAITSQFDTVDIEESYDNELINIVETEELDGEELDELYEEVKKEVIYNQKASASYIQRRYKVGFNRAQRILDQLEANGVIAPSEGTKPRKVLISEADIYED